MALFHKKLSIPSPEDALPGRAQKMPVPERHYVNGNLLSPPFPDGLELARIGLNRPGRLPNRRRLLGSPGVAFCRHREEPTARVAAQLCA